MAHNIKYYATKTSARKADLNNKSAILFGLEKQPDEYFIF